MKHSAHAVWALSSRQMLGSRDTPPLEPEGPSRRRFEPAQTAKYLASGCWNTSAETLASGSIMSPSVRWTPISSG